jgi:hypothetical protein
MKRLNKKQTEKFTKNLLLFTAPALALFFGQLASGVDVKVASGVALLALWGILADYFSKMKK